MADQEKGKISDINRRSSAPTSASLKPCPSLPAQLCRVAATIVIPKKRTREGNGIAFARSAAFTAVQMEPIAASTTGRHRTEPPANYSIALTQGLLLHELLRAIHRLVPQLCMTPRDMFLPLLIPQLYRADWQCECDSRPPRIHVECKMPQAMSTARSIDLRSSLTHLTALGSRPVNQSLRQSSWGGSKDLTCWAGQLGLQGAQMLPQVALLLDQPIYSFCIMALSRSVMAALSSFNFSFMSCSTLCRSPLSQSSTC